MKKSIITILFFIGIIIVGNIVAFRVVHVPDQLQIVVIFSLLVFYPILRFPLVGVYLLFIIMPFIPLLRRLYYLAYARPENDPLIIIGDLIVAVMILGLFFAFREQLQQGNIRFRVVFLVLFYFVYMVVRTVVANELPLGTALLQFRFFGPQVLLFFIGLLYADHEKHLQRLWGITIVIAVASVLYGLKQSLFGYSEAEKIWFSSIDFTSLFIKGIARPFSFFQSPAAFADYLQLAVIALVFFSGYGRAAGRAIWIFLPLFWTGVLITSVRSSWIGMALTFFIWLFIVRVRGYRQRLVFLSIMVICFMLFDVAQTVVQTGLGVGSLVTSVTGSEQINQTMTLLVHERAQAIENPFQEHSMLSRIALWKYIFNMTAHPHLALLGRGVGVINADSLYITYLADFGYPGLILIVILFAVFIRCGFKVIDLSRVSWNVSIATAIVTMNIVFAIISITGSHIHAFPGDSYFWFWNGVLVGIWHAQAAPEQAEEADETTPDA
ncbi:MAG: hypothetical protein JW768_14190 [Chitinispirillaceae bacterium]|nr:hypothetical protein [Chitinispirillaceae bacterium]